MEGKEKSITLFYNDGGGVSRKDGVLLELNDFARIRIASGQVIMIPRERIIRIEEVR